MQVQPRSITASRHAAQEISRSSLPVFEIDGGVPCSRGHRKAFVAMQHRPAQPGRFSRCCSASRRTMAALSASTMPNSESRPRMRLMQAVRCSMKPWRTRCRQSQPCSSRLLTVTKRMLGCCTASQMAAASTGSLLPRLPQGGRARRTWGRSCAPFGRGLGTGGTSGARPGRLPCRWRTVAGPTRLSSLARAGLRFTRRACERTMASTPAAQQSTCMAAQRPRADPATKGSLWRDF